MANTIQIKRSSTPSAAPGTLAAGELAVNTADKRLWVGTGAGSNALTIDASHVTSGTLATGRGGTGLSSLGSAGQILQVNSGGSALAYVSDIAGVAGGRYIYGGTAANDDLCLVTTSHPTKTASFIGFDEFFVNSIRPSLGQLTLAAKVAGVNNYLKITNGDGVTVGSVGDGCGFLASGTDAGATSRSIGRLKFDLPDVTAGATKGRVALTVYEGTTEQTGLEIDESANTIKLGLGGTTLLTITPSLATLASGVGLTLTSGDLTLSAGKITATASAESEIQLPTTGTSNILSLYNTASGAASNASTLRFPMKSSTGTKRQMCNMTVVCTTATDGAEVSRVSWSTMDAGTNTTRLLIQGSAYCNLSTPFGCGLATITTTPAAQIESLATTTQMRLTRTAATDFADFTVDTAGRLTIAPSTDGSAATGEVYLNATKLGFFSTAPVAKPSAYTQTYSTADKTHANPTATTLTHSVGTADGTVADVGASFNKTTLNNNFKDISTCCNALIVDVEDVKQLLNSVIDDLQSIGLVG